MIPEWLFRRLLLLYPHSFREEFEEEMVEFFRDRMREARRRGRGAVVLAALRVPADLLGSSARERLELSRRKRRKKPEEKVRGVMLETLSFDVKSATATLRHRPGVSLAVIATLALGITANTVVFAVVDAVLLRPLPYPEPERIVTLWNRYDSSLTSSSPPDYLDRRRDSQLLDSIAAFSSRPMNLSLDGDARRVETRRVTADFFRVMGAGPAAGAVSFPSEFSGEAERVAVLSFGFWRSAFGGDDAVLGRTIRLDGESYLVTGIMPEGFDTPPRTEVFVPLVFTPEQLADGNRGNESLTVVGRMKEETELDALEREMNAIAASVLERVPERRDFLERNGWGASVVPLHEHLTRDSRSVLAMLSAAVLLVLLVTGANVAHLLLSSGSARRQELVLRASLGATRRRIVGQLVAESVLLAAAGGLLGLLLASSLLRALPAFLPADLPRMETIALDFRGAAFTFAVALGMGILCGLVPAWQASLAGVPAASSRSSAAGGARRLRGMLVVSEMALALVLLIAAGLLVRSFEQLSHRDPGFDPSGRVSFGIDFPPALFPEPQARLAAVRELLSRLSAIPGVSSATASERVPFRGARWTGTFFPDGYVPARGESTPGADFNRVTPGYVRTMGMPLLRGRDFEPADSSRVLLIDEWTEKRFWPEGAVGRKINFAGPTSPPDLYEIVGVVGHVQYESLDEPGRFQLYYLAADYVSRRLELTLRAETDPAVLLPLIRAEIARLSPDLAIHSFRPLEELVGDSLVLRRLQTALTGAFGLLVLALAGVGIYGVLSYSVTQRRMEVGIRMALGASGGKVLRLVLKEGLLLVGLGIAFGWLGSGALSRLMASFLYGVEATDGATYLVTTAVLALVAVAASLVPALRAARTDPLLALRSD